MAESHDAIFVAFLGTKRPSDHLVNLRLRHTPLLGRAGSWPGNWSGSSLSRSDSSASLSSLSSLDSEGSGSWSDGEGGAPEGAAAAGQAAAHSGYLWRAASIPAEQLYQLARVQGKRLVLAGVCCVSRAGGRDGVCGGGWVGGWGGGRGGERGLSGTTAHICRRLDLRIIRRGVSWASIPIIQQRARLHPSLVLCLLASLDPAS